MGLAPITILPGWSAQGLCGHRFMLYWGGIGMCGRCHANGVHLNSYVIRQSLNLSTAPSFVRELSCRTCGTRTFPVRPAVLFHHVCLVHTHGKYAIAETFVKYAPGHRTQLRDKDVARVRYALPPSAGVQNIVKRKM